MKEVLRIAAVAACFAASAPVVGAPADEVRALVEGGKAAEAYELGRRNPDALGDPAFDFFFGIAAIDTGHAAEGVLALERYVLRFPDNLSARLQLARGYFTLGEDARAREEFEQLLKLNPPADTAVTIDRFLDSIRLRETRYTATSGAYLEAGIGRDTNVNAGPGILNSATLKADFVARSIALNMTASQNANAAFTMSGVSSFSSTSGRFAAGFQSISCAGASCPGVASGGSFGGFFAGASAEGAGLAFTAGVPGVAGVTGVVGFKR